MKIEIWSDVMCPWCYIGKKRFEKALEQFEGSDEVEIQWKSFQLNPQLETDTSRRVSDYLSETKGWSKEQVQEAEQRVTEVAAEEGLEYHLDKAVVANSMNAHRLLHFAAEKNLANTVSEKLFDAYFSKGVNTDDHQELIRIGVESGLDKNELKDVLASDKYRDEVLRDQMEAQNLGCKGVPFFVIDRKYGISGAQPTEYFLESLQKKALEDKSE